MVGARKQVSWLLCCPGRGTRNVLSWFSGALVCDCPWPRPPGAERQADDWQRFGQAVAEQGECDPHPTAALPPKTRALPCMAPSGSLFSWLGLFCHEPIVVTSNCLKCLTWTFVPLGRPANFSSLSP